MKVRLDYMKRLMTVLLCICMVLAMIPAALAYDGTQYSVGDTFTFGSYPQSRVTDTDTLNSFINVEETWQSYGYYTGTGTMDDGNMTSSDYMQYADFTYDGVKYRAVKFTQYRPTCTGYASSADKSYQDDNGYKTNTIYYFRYDPLTWKVIDPDEGFVICTNIIDAQPYQDFVYKSNDIYYNSKDCTEYATDWETSTLRKWLNDDFYNTAFSEEEKAQIALTSIGDTSDAIFVLSTSEAGSSDYGFTKANRKLKQTEYAKCQGLNIEAGSINTGNSSWWLRTANYYSYSGSRNMHVTFIDGEVDTCYYIGVTQVGVVPAFKFCTESPVEITVTFEKNGGEWASGYTAPTSYMSNQILTLPTAENITRDGLNFKGWELTTDTDTAKTYTAQWQELTPQIICNYAGYLGIFDMFSTYVFNESQSMKIPMTLEIDDAWYGTTISIVKKGTDSTLDSEPQLLAIPAKPAAPTSVGIENVTGKDAEDGKITGVSTEMEYMPEGGSWTNCAGDTVTGLGAGTYTVRYKSTDSSFASESVTVTIAVEEEQPYTSSDALLVLKYCVDSSIGGVTLERHDLNGDGTITSSDALAILKLCANS